MFTASIFSEVLKLLPREIVKKAVHRFNSDHWVRSFSTFDHLVAMLGAQLSGSTSLREVEVLFGAHQKHHYHLGCSGVKRSTLSDANVRRDWRVFGEISRLLMQGGQRHNDPVHALLSVLDSSPIRLAGHGYEWAGQTAMRHGNQGLKLHLLMQPGNGDFDYAAVTDMNVSDLTHARGMSLESGRIYVFDRGYFDFNWWHEITRRGSHFITRLKRNTAYRVIENVPLPDSGEADDVLADEVIELTNKTPRGGKTNPLFGTPLRRVTITHPDGSGRPFAIVSDLHGPSAHEIAAMYKQRWSIELVFKWIKQNLKIKKFMGRSRNAVAIQIFSAIITYLLVRRYKKLLGKAHQLRLKDLMTLLKTGLFQRTPPKSIHPPPSKQNQFQLNLWQEKPA